MSNTYRKGILINESATVRFNVQSGSIVRKQKNRERNREAPPFVAIAQCCQECGTTLKGNVYYGYEPCPLCGWQLEFPHGQVQED